MEKDKVKYKETLTEDSFSFTEYEYMYKCDIFRPFNQPNVISFRTARAVANVETSEEELRDALRVLSVDYDEKKKFDILDPNTNAKIGEMTHGEFLNVVRSLFWATAAAKDNKL